MKLLTYISAGLVLLTTGCANHNFEGTGNYVDENGAEKKVVLAYKAQVYYIPFVNSEVDYGSISLKAQCIDNDLLDGKNNDEHGLVFLERPQQYKLAEGAPSIRVGNYRVCAQLKSGESLEQINSGDTVTLSTYCQAKNNNPAIIPANVEGYMLTVNTVDEVKPLPCNSALAAGM